MKQQNAWTEDELQRLAEFSHNHTTRQIQLWALSHLKRHTLLSVVDKLYGGGIPYVRVRNTWTKEMRSQASRIHFDDNSEVLHETRDLDTIACDVEARVETSPMAVYQQTR